MGVELDVNGEDLYKGLVAMGDVESALLNVCEQKVSEFNAQASAMAQGAPLDAPFACEVRRLPQAVIVCTIHAKTRAGAALNRAHGILKW